MHELQKLSLHRYRSECGGFGGGGGCTCSQLKDVFN